LCVYVCLAVLCAAVAVVCAEVTTVAGFGTRLHLACVGGCEICGAKPTPGSGEAVYQRLNQFFWFEAHRSFLPLSASERGALMQYVVVWCGVMCWW
jgi:hypothetical protein